MAGVFENEKEALLQGSGKWCCDAIEDVGSTSVPGLAAKPVIDIMLSLEKLDVSKPAIEALTEVEYGYYPYKSEVLHWFCKPEPDYRTHPPASELL